MSTSTVDRAATPSPPAQREQREQRKDIQAMRALAVSLVVVYHLWPRRLTGGFIGVDVFFVISGFLITSHLLSHPPRSGRDVAQFWARRARRLLPASLLVLTATLAASRLFAPETAWQNTAEQTRFAALYVVNWRLAHDSVNYLASQDPPTPVQHFWSLSVEEQFYLVWPLLIVLAVWLARRGRRRTNLYPLVALTLVVAASLWFSVHETAANPAAAYFVTPTRIWELGSGGLLAAVQVARRGSGPLLPEPVRRPVSLVLVWAGLACIVFAAVTYTGATPFPGWRALLPVAGSVAVIAAEVRPGWLSPARFMSLRPVQGIGDLSYSIYLWHWPIIVLLPNISGGRLGILDDAAIIVASVVLSWLTKRFVEDRFRRPRSGRPALGRVLVAVVAGMALVVGATVVQTTEVSHRLHDEQVALARKLSGSDPCLGARAVAHRGNCPRTTDGTLYPAPAEAANNRSPAYVLHHGVDCFANQPDFPLRTCTHGAGRGTKVALVGNSHAGQWYGTVSKIADEQHWRVTAYLSSQCALAQTRQTLAVPADTANCLRWVSDVVHHVVTGGFGMVVMANRVSVDATGLTGAASQAAYRRGYEAVLSRFVAAHVHVVVIRDTPAPGDAGVTSIPQCLATHTSDYQRCDGTRATWLPKDPTVDAARSLHSPYVTVADLTDDICYPTVCPAAAGHVPVYFDASHLTATFALTLAPFLRSYLVRAAPRAG